MDPEEDTDLDNNEYDGWTTPETTEYNEGRYSTNKYGTN